MINLETTYLGLELRNPIIASSGPLAHEIANLKQMEDAGAGAVVLHSLFEEQITAEEHVMDSALSATSDVSAEAISLWPDIADYGIGPHEYLEHIRKAREALQIPVIASLNGVSNGGWVRFARLMEDAGANAIELNIYFVPTNPALTATQVEAMYTELVANVNSSIHIPLAVKLAPYFTAFANFAHHLDMAGADALVLFNRFYQPDFDLESLEVVPTLELSRSDDLRLRLTWAALLYGRVDADIAITGGVHTAEDVVKCMMAGARAAMTTSALLKNGIDYLRSLLAELHEWLEKHEYESIRQMQGSMSARSVADPAAFERANYMRVLTSYPVKPGS